MCGQKADKTSSQPHISFLISLFVIKSVPIFCHTNSVWAGHVNKILYFVARDASYMMRLHVLCHWVHGNITTVTKDLFI